jgi:hypothetical protein
MKRTTLFGIALFASVAFSAGLVLAADPTLTEVYRAAESGNLKQAESMMDQVLRDHPNSAKAHFVEAEILAKEGKLEMSRAELGTAERLAPGLPFAKPGAVTELTQRLNGPAVRQAPVAAPMTVAPVAPAANFPWGMVLVGLALIAAAIFFFRNLNRPRVYPASPQGYAPGPSSYGPGGYPQQPAGPGGYPQPVGPMGSGGIGSGILGGLATGAAVGAGMVAGEALMHNVFGGGSGSAHAAEAPRPLPANDYQPLPDANYDLGGNDFGVSDAGSWDDGSSGGGGSDDWG